MEFLNNFVLPQSAEHIELLHYMLLIVLFLFIPFISIVFGGIFLSVVYKYKANKHNSNFYLRLSKDVAEITTINKSAGFIFGIIPLITAILIYSQLLYNSEITNLNYLGLALVFIIISLVFIYSYRYSLSFNRIFRSLSDKNISDPLIIEEVNKLSDESNRISQKAGNFGLLFLFMGIWFFITALTIPSIYSSWDVDSFIGGIFSWQVLSRFIYYIFFSLTLAGGMVLFIYLEDEKKKHIKDEEYSEFLKQRVLRVTFLSATLIPLFALFSLFGLPQNALTGTVFTYAIISLALLFLGYHFLYLLTKEIKGTTAALLFFTLVFSIAAFIISDQKAMATSTQVHSAMLSAEFDKYLAELKGEGKIVSINAEEIYEVKCASCHKWDQKLVGPAHLDVLPKYDGKESQLIAFIRNPGKVDPAYPPMPNPGLKPNEAEAVAKYLLETYEKKK
ncbi:MAG: c-type cytochrome [Ignavibacteriaceae bacterium]